MSDPAFKRATRVSQQLQKELAVILVEGVKDPRVGFVTVTEVRMSDDLRNARVYVSVYGPDAEREASLAGLRDAAGYLKRELARRVTLRYMPTLSFFFDDSLDRAARLDDVFHAIHGGESEPPDPNAVEHVPVQTNRSAMADSAKGLEIPPPAKKPGRKRNRRRRPQRR